MGYLRQVPTARGASQERALPGSPADRNSASEPLRGGCYTSSCSLPKERAFAVVLEAPHRREFPFFSSRARLGSTVLLLGYCVTICFYCSGSYLRCYVTLLPGIWASYKAQQSPGTSSEAAIAPPFELLSACSLPSSHSGTWSVYPTRTSCLCPDLRALFHRR